jgi:hypothetical protein
MRADMRVVSRCRPLMHAGFCLAALLCLFTTQIWCQWSCAEDDGAKTAAHETPSSNHGRLTIAGTLPPDDCPGATLPAFTAAATPRVAVRVTTTLTPAASYPPTSERCDVPRSCVVDTSPPFPLPHLVLRI